VQQLREAFPWDRAPRYLLRDRDGIFGRDFVSQVNAIGIKEVLSAPRSHWQRAYIERLIGTFRRECLDHVIVLNQASLCRYVKLFTAYYHDSRTHLSYENPSSSSEARRERNGTGASGCASLVAMVKTAKLGYRFGWRGRPCPFLLIPDENDHSDGSYGRSYACGFDRDGFRR
jgi:putative transposase